MAENTPETALHLHMFPGTLEPSDVERMADHG